MDAAALKRLAESQLMENVRAFRCATGNDVELLCAGSDQCRSVWVRDACYASLALKKMGRQDLVANLVRLYLYHVKEDLTPIKVFDVTNPESRYFASSLRKLGSCCGTEPIEGSWLVPWRRDSRGAFAFDSHLLIMLAFTRCSPAFIATNNDDPTWAAMFGWYKPSARHGLLEQPPFSEWKDSLALEGAHFLTNLLYAQVAARFRFEGVDVDVFHANMRRRFSHRGVFRMCLEHRTRVALDGNLLLHQWMRECPRGAHLLDQKGARAHFEALSMHQIWGNASAADYGDLASTDCFCLERWLPAVENLGLPGFPVWPGFANYETSWQVKLAGMSAYHDATYWSWLLALSAETAFFFGDFRTGRRVMRSLGEAVRRDGGVGEVYFHAPGLPALRTILYRSEPRFSWGAAFVYLCVSPREGELR